MALKLPIDDSECYLDNTRNDLHIQKETMNYLLNVEVLDRQVSPFACLARFINQVNFWTIMLVHIGAQSPENLKEMLAS